MRKALFYALVFFFVLLCFGGFYSWKYKEALLSNLLSRAFSVPVSMERVDVCAWGIKVQDLCISNPPNGRMGEALKAKNFQLKIDPLSLFGDTFVIKDIFLDGAFFGLEMYDLKGKKNNWEQLLSNLSSSKELSEDKSESMEGRRKERGVVIKKIFFKDVQFKIVNPVLGSSQTRISEFSVENIGEGGRVSSRKTIELIVKTMISYMSKLPKFQGFLKNAVNLPKNIVEEVFSLGKKNRGEEDRGLEEEKSGKNVFFEKWKEIDGFIKKVLPQEREEKK